MLLNNQWIIEDVQRNQKTPRASLEVEWLRIHLPVLATWDHSLVREDLTRCGTTKHAPQQLSHQTTSTNPTRPRAWFHNKRSHCKEKLMHHNEE